MKRRIWSAVLALALVLTMAPLPAARAAGAADGWFSRQLTEQGKIIYNEMVKMYGGGHMKTGRESYDLAPAVGQEAIRAYDLHSDRTLFNDFAAAKDAFDLEHPEAWYMDSSYLSFRVTQEGGTYHAWMGPGRAASYHLNGRTISDVDARTAAVEQAVNEIVAGAWAISSAGLSAEEYAVRQVQYVHDQVTRRISYRYEIDCTAGNEDYIRTIYALVTHEGVCEGYARSMQYILDKLDIPCVLVHGMQTSGDDPEAHMWNAVRIGGAWYIVDATWDDPVGLDKNGSIIKTATPGVDGGEHRNYFLVGRENTANWAPSGQVSVGGKTFTYPEISLRSYAGIEAFQDGSGLVVKQNVSSEMEGTRATEFQVSFQGKGVAEAAKTGYYLLIKYCDLDASGQVVDIFEDGWYYLAAAQAILDNQNPFVTDSPDCFRFTTVHSRYVELAVTSRPPKGYDPNKDFREYVTYLQNAISGTNGVPKDLLAGYYRGDGSDILCDTGLIYNPNGNYKAAPYVKSSYPVMTQQLDAGHTYRAQVEFDDTLIHPTQATIEAYQSSSAGVEEEESAEVLAGLRDAAGKTPGARYETSALDINGDLTPHVIQGDVTFGNIAWHWACGNSSHQHSFETCGVTGLDFDFKASDKWADDSVCYEFFLDGLVGKLSNKQPNAWNWVMSTPSCPVSYRSQGIDWNLWGQPSLLDNPDDLDLSKVQVKGADGRTQSLDSLDSRMNKSGYNGKLALTVEDISRSRPRSEEVTGALEKAGVDPDAVRSKLLYEIGFTRICKMVVLETGQSVRISVGYPEGVSYENLKDYVIKAYHFTRCEEGACKQNHQHTGEIISTEELQVTATPYGLVILCNSFSPFEIVALDPAKASASSKFTADASVIVGTDGNGTILVDGKPAVGADGFVSFAGGAQHTFTVRPDAGYQLDEISFSGKKAVTVGSDNTFTLTADDLEGSAILSAAFVPAAAAGTQTGEVVAPKACLHEHTTGTDYRAPTCTQPGYTEGKTCLDCGMVLSTARLLPATGHEEVVTGVAKEPTCTEEGVSGLIICSVCKELVSEHSPIPAKGHTYETLTTVAKATCTAEGSERVQCTVCGEVQTRVVPMTPHTYQNSVCTVCGAREGQAPGEMPFADVKAGEYYYDAVKWAVEKGVTTGTSETTFSPSASCTRGQIVTFLWRANGSPKPTAAANPFSDVKSTDYYYDAVLWAVEKGITTGTSETTFSPASDCTRSQIVTFLWRSHGQPAPAAGAAFTDLEKGAYYKDAVDWAVARGVTTGTSETTFSPGASCTRSQSVTFLYRDQA